MGAIRGALEELQLQVSTNSSTPSTSSTSDMYRMLALVAVVAVATGQEWGEEGRWEEEGAWGEPGLWREEAVLLTPRDREVQAARWASPSPAATCGHLSSHDITCR